MESKGLRAGHLMALAGALVALASLWRPWYRIELTQAFRDALGGQIAQTPSPFGAFAKGLIDILPSRLEASGWQELQGADVALCLGTIAIVALVVGAAGAFGSAVRVDPAAAGKGIALVAGLGLALTVQHALSRPGGAAAADVVKLGGGLWMAMAGCAVALAGGLLAARTPPAESVPAFASAPAAPAALLEPAGSVAPPRP